MKKVLLGVIFTLTLLTLLLPAKASAMMHTGSFEDKAGSRSELSDEEYERLGEEWMGVMMGENHEDMDQQIKEMMGEDFLRQMHIAMGKRSENPGSFGMMPMMGMMGMGGFGNMMGAGSLSTPFSSLYSLLGITTWIVFIAFLVAATRWFWKKAGK